jgi:hypothetical protein
MCKGVAVFKFEAHHFIKLAAVISALVVCIMHWHMHVLVLIILFIPYLVLYYLATKSNYKNAKVALLRGTASIAVFIVAIRLGVVGIEMDAQAAIPLFIFVGIQLTAISAAEFIVLFFLTSEKRT